MHIIERFFDADTTKTKSETKDLRDHVSMAIQVKGLNGGTLTIYGTLFEKQHYLPVTIECLNSPTITQDGIYTVSPRFRYYYAVLNRNGSSAPVWAYLYAVKAGAFWQQDACESETDQGFLDQLRQLGTQKDIIINSSILTGTMDIQATSDIIPADSEAYLHHIVFDVKGSGGAHVQVLKKIGSTETILNQYILTGYQPTIIDPIYFLDKMNKGNSTANIVIRAKKMLYNYDSCLLGRVTYIQR